VAAQRCCRREPSNGLLTFWMSEESDPRLYHAHVARNREPILEVLRRVISVSAPWGGSMSKREPQIILKRASKAFTERSSTAARESAFGLPLAPQEIREACYLMLKLGKERTQGALPYNVTPERTERAANILGRHRF
jgi:hypothetical protein